MNDSSRRTAVTITRFCDALGRVLTLLARLAIGRERHALARGRLTMPHMLLLDHLAARTVPPSMGEIAASFRLRRSTLSQIVDGLVDKGLAAREHAAADRRRVLVRVTPRGHRIVRAFRLERRRTFRALFAHVPSEQRALFLNILERAAALFSSGEAPGPRRRRRCAAVVFAIGLAYLHGAAAEPPPRLTLDDCLRSGLARSVALANAARDRAAADAMIADMRAPLLPELRTHADYLRRDQLDSFEFGGPPVTFGRLDNYNAGIELRQLLYDGGSVAAGLRAAQSYRDRMDLAAERVREGLARDIRIGFHSLCYLEEARRVQAATIAMLDEFADDMDRKFRQGAASEFDAMSARVRAANERPLLATVERELAVARAAFRNLARLDSDEFELVPDEGEPERTADLMDLATAIRIALAERRELQEQQKLIELRSADLRAERGTYAPIVRARGAYEGRNPESFVSSEDRWDWRWEAGLTVEWTWYDGGRRAARVRQKELALASARADLEELERRLRLEVEEAWMRRIEARQAAAAAEQTVRLAEQSVAIARTRVDAGVATRLDFTDATLALRRARLQWYAARRDLRHADTQLAYTIGRPLLPSPENPR